MNKFLGKLLSALFLKNSSKRLAFAASTGVLIGLLPLFGIRFLIVFLISILFKLNIIALFTGVIFASFCPAIINFIVWGMGKNVDNSILLLTVIAGILLVLASHVFFKGIYFYMFNNIEEGFVKKLIISSTIGVLISFIQPLFDAGILTMSGIVLLFLIFKFNIFGIVTGVVFGTGIIIQIVRTLIFWAEHGFSGKNISVLLSGVLSPWEFLNVIVDMQFNYLFVILIFIFVPFLFYPIFKFVFSRKSVYRFTGEKDYIYKDDTGMRWLRVKQLTGLVMIFILIQGGLFYAGLGISTSDNAVEAFYEALESEDKYLEINEYEYGIVCSNYKLKKASESEEVALVFTGETHHEYTSQILEILKEKDLKATFFVSGKNAYSHSGLLKRIYNDGHDIGNHRYSNEEVSNGSYIKKAVGINLTNNIIEMFTGHSSILLMQPYVEEGILDSSEKLEFNKIFSDKGYIVFESPNGIEEIESYSPEQIVEKANEDIKNKRTIIMQNSEDTVESLPLIVESIEDRGYKLNSISGLMGMERDKIMQPVNVINSMYYRATYFCLSLINNVTRFLSNLFVFALILGVIRIVFVIFLSHRQKKKHSQMEFKYNYNPLVTVVIAAYNEEKVICETVESILQSDYSNLEVLVVNDGSKDGTEKVVREEFFNNPRVSVITKENGGKASSVNRGFKEAKGEIVIVMDADTLLDKKAVSLLIRHFENENVAAVSGNIKVGNKDTILTMWQHIEYVTGFSLERRAFSELNCIPVVPGAIGAWRKELVASLGYYKEDTLAEDAEITIEFLKRGYRILYEEGARAYTEAPDKLSGLLKQRVRWIYGALQVIYKHREVFLNPKYSRVGFITLPNIILYQFIFQSISPAADILFVSGLIKGDILNSTFLYLAFLSIEFVLTFYAFSIEKENKKPLRWILLQRLFYRPFMTYVVYKAIYSAVKGVKVGWNKLKRRGNVKKQDSVSIMTDTNMKSA
ncbi:glycosyltransferase [Herbivorax sp. ANBcel31]|uniref:glycosyltransferase n=1 Tax=Herbivorax sp. ANBcel31 TaxID=3069754 RepID=UPI0027B341B7|nr:glycosyltransferase [Herbivorax sp. ANBcel31]MDQ2088058.1 glycosyltransferase [Herbivorax sp. ANBcel31]